MNTELVMMNFHSILILTDNFFDNHKPKPKRVLLRS